MKKILILLGLGLLMLPGIAGADSTSIDLDNYYFAHANKPGNYVLKDKYNNTVIKGDYGQNDAHVMQISFRNWHASGSNKVVVDLPDGSQKNVTNGETLTFPSDPKQISLTLVKTDYTESYVEVSTFNVYDQSGGGVNLTYTFTGSPPSSYGDLGAGTPTASATPKPTVTPTPTPKPTVTPTPTSGVTPVNIQARVDPTGKKIIWNTPPTNTDHIEVWRDGELIGTFSKTQGEINLPENFSGDWEIRAVSAAGNIIGKTELILNGNVGGGDPTPTPIPTNPPDTGTDPGTEIPCNDACQQIKDQLECPEFDEYLGKWADMIKGTYPPPPDWEHVASVMRDKIVPAMGQEIVNRSPEIARIIADEFESRESKVNPPPDLAGYDPVVPRFTDTPSVKEDLNSNVPDFTPDYSESTPFTIPDPMNVDLTDNSDKGYAHKEPDSSSPVYQQKEVEGAALPSYNHDPTWAEGGKDYQVDNPILNEPKRDYNYQTPAGSAAPSYESNSDGVPNNADYNFNEDNQIPEYGGE